MSLDHHVPVIETTVTVRPQIPWITEKGRDAVKKREQCKKKLRSSGLIVHREIFKDQRLAVRKLSRGYTSHKGRPETAVLSCQQPVTLEPSPCHAHPFISA